MRAPAAAQANLEIDTPAIAALKRSKGLMENDPTQVGVGVVGMYGFLILQPYFATLRELSAWKYAGATVSDSRALVDPKAGTASLMVELASGPPYRFGRDKALPPREGGLVAGDELRLIGQ